MPMKVKKKKKAGVAVLTPDKMDFKTKRSISKRIEPL